MSGVNVERLEAVMAFINAHPERHDQSRWCNRAPLGAEECGTTACFAGWTAEMYARQEGYRPRGDVAWLIGDGGHTRMVHVQDVAEELLGLDGSEATKLFDANNSRRMLELMVKDLANGEELRDTSSYEDEEREESRP